MTADARSLISRIVAALCGVALALMTGCSRGPSGNDDLAAVLDAVPGTVTGIRVIDLGSFAQAHGLDHADLGTFAELTEQVRDMGHGSRDPLALLHREIASIAPALHDGDAGHHRALDLASASLIVDASGAEATFVVMDEPERAREIYLEEGFVVRDDDEWLEPPGRADARRALVHLGDRGLILAHAPEAVDGIAQADGAPEDLREMVEAADESSWLISSLAASHHCGTPYAVARGAESSELILGGDHRLLPAADLPPLFGTVGTGEPDGNLTRYAIEPADEEIGISFVADSQPRRAPVIEC